MNLFRSFPILVITALGIAAGVYAEKHFSPTRAQLVEIEKSVRDFDGQFHYRSPLRLPRNPGLPRSLLSRRNSVLSDNPEANLIFLIVQKPAVANVWEASYIAKSLFNVLEGRQALSVGHVQWGWSCKLHGERQEGASGYTGEQRDQALQMALEGWGATAGLMKFNDGFFEDPWETEVQIQKTNREDIKILTVKTDAESCEKFLTSYEKMRFLDLLSGFQLILPFPNELSGKIETGSCGSIAMLLFKNIKNLPPGIFENSHSTLKIPKSLLGFPTDVFPQGSTLHQAWIDQLKDRRGTSVNLMRAFANLKEDDETIEVNFIDPQKIFNSVAGLGPTI